MNAPAQLTAALNAAKGQPCNIVGVGSSTMAGYLQSDVEKRWFTLLIRAWQSEFGGNDAVQYNSTAVFAARTGAGVHGYNRGLASMTSANYLWSGDIIRINALRPSAVLHAICSNDLQQGINPSTSKSNLLSKLDQFDSGVPHIFVHHHKRFNQLTFPYFWGDYLNKLREIEKERNNVTVINLAYGFEHELGIPSSDVFKLMLSDKTHLNEKGHLTLAQRVHAELLP